MPHVRHGNAGEAPGISARDAGLPQYEVPRPALLSFGVDLLLGRRRSFVRDGRMVMRTNPHPRRIEGADNVPREGAFVLVMNHFSRAGLRPYHCAMIVSATIADARRDQAGVRWAFTSEYLGRRVGPVPIPLWLIRWVFRRVALVYGFVIIPRREQLVAGRAAALRRFGRLLHEGSPVGLTPEGAAPGASGRLVEPPAGSGLFVATLARTGVPPLPVGVFEEGRTLVVRFGAPFDLSLPDEVSRLEKDRIARTAIMASIGALLPREYRGAYEEIVAARPRPSAT
jgi:1-acyl-sn-glycerol-3-phosphate acyltransferase